ncbi:MAG: acyltransferase 3 [Myxococcales bacterium]|nr:acyltransferase 3 [Myxococcales bacterium]
MNRFESVPGGVGTGERPRRLVAIDALRGVAVLAVVIGHLPFSMSLATDSVKTSALPWWFTKTVAFGGYGVNLFFVISGFCIHMSWARSPEAKIDFVGFWRRRLHRLYPPYFVALIGSLAGLFLLHRLLGDAGSGIGSRFGYGSTSAFLIDLAVLLLLLQNFNGASHRIGNGPFWSLAIEEHLYLLYFPLLWLRRKLGWTRTFAIVLAVTLGWRIAADFAGPPFSVFHAPARWAEWVLGAIAVEAHLGRTVLPSWCYSLPLGLVLLALGLAAGSPAALASPTLHTLIFMDLILGAAFFVILNSACRAGWGAKASDGRMVRVLSRVGLFSYSIYLVHEPLIVAAKHVAIRFGWSIPAIAAARLLVAIGGGYLFFVVVERRFLNRTRAEPISEALPPAATAQ